MSEKLLNRSNAGPEAEEPPDSDQGAQYGCVFCRTGQERLVAQGLAAKYQKLETLVVLQIKHKSLQGVKSTQEHILLPGYVFFQVLGEAPSFFDIRSIQGVIGLLRDFSGEWRLADQDRRFARWAFAHGGVIGLSKAYTVGDKVRILSGPLKDYEGSIVKIDRRSRNGQIKIRFDGRVWKVWLAFELVEMQTVQAHSGGNTAEA